MSRGRNRKNSRDNTAIPVVKQEIANRATSSTSVYAGGRTPFVSRALPDTHVTGDLALTYGPVFRCIALIAGPICSMPRRHYTKLPNGGREELNSDISWLLNIQPNPEMTAYDWLQSMLLQRLLWGDAYSEIERDLAGRPIALWPLSTEFMMPRRKPDTRQLYYEYWNETGRPTILQTEDVLVFKGLSYDGITSYSPIQLAQRSVALGISEEKFSLSYFGNGAVPGGIIEDTLGKKTPEAVQTLIETFNDIHQGPSRAHRVHYLDAGMTYKPIAVPADTIRFLESGQFQVEVIARWFGVPPHKLGLTDRQNTAGNVEQQNLQYITDTLMPLVTSMESELAVKLLGRNTRGREFFRFDFTELLRGDMAALSAKYSSGVRAGYLTRNEVRLNEGLPPLATLDVPLQEVNLVSSKLAEEKGRMEILKLQSEIEVLEANAEKTEGTTAEPDTSDSEMEDDVEMEEGGEMESEDMEVEDSSKKMLVRPSTRLFMDRLGVLEAKLDMLANRMLAQSTQQPFVLNLQAGTPDIQLNPSVQLPAINVTVDQPATQITVENQMEAQVPDVRVENILSVPEREVKIEHRVENVIEAQGAPVVNVNPNVVVNNEQMAMPAPVVNVENVYDFKVDNVVEQPGLPTVQIVNQVEVPAAEVRVDAPTIVNKNEIVVPESPAPIVNVIAESQPNIVNEIIVPEVQTPDVRVENVVNVAPSPAPDIYLQVDPAQQSGE